MGTDDVFCLSIRVMQLAYVLFCVLIFGFH
jgi:hypothetical protein